MIEIHENLCYFILKRKKETNDDMIYDIKNQANARRRFAPILKLFLKEYSFKNLLGI
jgi:hypothetical protein